MAIRIRTDQPSGGKPKQLYVDAGFNSGFLSDTIWYTLAEAPDFSVPSTGDTGVTVDPGDPDRELRPGEIFFDAPLVAGTAGSGPAQLEFRILLEDGASPFSLAVDVVPGDLLFLPLQGQRLLRYDFAAANGGRLQVKASVDGELLGWGSALELEANDHAPDSEA